MKIYKIEKIIRYARDVIVLNFSSFVGKTYINNPRETIDVEVTSYCNLKCRFCAYRKKKSSKTNMSNEFFFNCVEQATRLGFRDFSLTPVTGDVFMDPFLFDKLDFLEKHREVDSYFFFTNFTIPDNSAIERLIKLKKMRHLTISVYGHDLESFVAITQSNEKIYRRLVSNLNFFLSKIDEINFELELGLRSYNKIPFMARSELKELLDSFAAKGVKIRRSRVYNNWGGSIAKEDVKGLDIDIGGIDSVYKKGACVMLFNRIMIKADGVVNACPCRDVDTTLKIGDLINENLEDILSANNKIYMKLINDQQRGLFPAVCNSCDFYKSIYRRRGARRREFPPLSLNGFMQLIRSTEEYE